MIFIVIYMLKDSVNVSEIYENVNKHVHAHADEMMEVVIFDLSGCLNFIEIFYIKLD